MLARTFGRERWAGSSEVGAHWLIVRQGRPEMGPAAPGGRMLQKLQLGAAKKKRRNAKVPAEAAPVKVTICAAAAPRVRG